MHHLLSMIGPTLGEAAIQAYKSLFDFNPDAIYFMDTNGRFLCVNPACEQISGYKTSELVGIPFVRLLQREDVEFTCERFAEVLKGIPQTYDVRFVHRSGKIVHLHVTNVPMTRDGQIIGAYGIARDITPEKEAEESLSWLALHDPLTKLRNRTGVAHWIVEMTRKSRESRRLAVLLVGFDSLREVTALLGQESSDQLLVSVSKRLQELMPPNAFLARWSTDEFVILLGHVSDDILPAQVAQSITSSTENPVSISGQSICISYTIGLAVGITTETNPLELVSKASAAFHYAKQKGKPGYMIYNSIMSEFIRKRFQLANDLRQGLLREEFTLFYQPIVSLRSNTVVGLEALVRWQHPQRGLLSPADFITVADDIGLIVLPPALDGAGAPGATGIRQRPIPLASKQIVPSSGTYLKLGTWFSPTGGSVGLVELRNYPPYVGFIDNPLVVSAGV